MWIITILHSKGEAAPSLAHSLTRFRFSREVSTCILWSFTSRSGPSATCLSVKVNISQWIQLGKALLLCACIVKAKYFYSKSKQRLWELGDSRQFSKKRKSSPLRSSWRRFSITWHHAKMNGAESPWYHQLDLYFCEGMHLLKELNL